MKFKVNGLGVVRRAEIELKPLTIFVGPNNAGKTWLAYTIAGILGKYGQKEYAKALTTNNVQNTYPLINHVIQRVLEQGYATIDIARFAEQFGSIYINNVAEFAQSWMQEYLGTRRAVFNNLKVQVNLTDTEPDFLQQVLARAYSNDFPRKVSREEALLNATKEGNNPLLYFYTEKDIAEKLPPQERGICAVFRDSEAAGQTMPENPGRELRLPRLLLQTRKAIQNGKEDTMPG